MEDALRTLLERLEAIEEDYDGLGDTIVRDFMGDDILCGFLRLEPGFPLSGEYDLDPEANRLVKKAFAEFFTAARAAGKREGLHTFHQRLAAFQDVNVKTAGGADYNDFFGCKDGGHGLTLPGTTWRPGVQRLDADLVLCRLEIAAKMEKRNAAGLVVTRGVPGDPQERKLLR